MLCSCLEQLTASILTHTGPGEAPTTSDVRERDRRSKRCNYIDSSAVAAAPRETGREGRAKPPPATPPSTNLKTIFDVAAAAAE